jgi:hypothetical protein
MSRAGHLTRRFVGALRPGGPSAADTTWVRGVLTDPEYDLWARLPGHDRRHAVAVARRVDHALAPDGGGADPRWLAAALLHDVGKLDAGLGVVGRSVATVMGAVAGPSRVDRWAQTSGFRRRAAWYLHHDDRGADRIRAAGGREDAARWASAHHHRTRWPESGVPITVAEALEAADNA